jgi:two-component system phosphate regulon sensor histidine kinase PhoR
MLLEKEKIDIMASIHKTIDIIQLKYPEAIIDWQPFSGNRIIIADPFHFSNIIYNLLDNSIKYCEKRALIQISLEQKPKGLLLRIKDNGIGIAQRDLKHIFEKFYRVHEEKKKPVPGFGLGLFYVHKICQLHGWTLQAESVPGSGTSMTILIR